MNTKRVLVLTAAVAFSVGFFLGVVAYAYVRYITPI